MSFLSNKSDILALSADMLHRESMYPAVAHCSYYSCYQLLKHIWLHSMNQTEEDLGANCSLQRFLGSHEYLLNEVSKHIAKFGRKDSRNDVLLLNKNFSRLKRLRVEADYMDKGFDYTQSSTAISLSKEILPILKKY